MNIEAARTIFNGSKLHGSKILHNLPAKNFFAFTNFHIFGYTPKMEGCQIINYLKKK